MIKIEHPVRGDTQRGFINVGGMKIDPNRNAMIEHPILVNRPIVESPLGTKLCRPSEVVLDLLERKPESFTKEDGEVVRIEGPRP